MGNEKICESRESLLLPELIHNFNIRDSLRVFQELNC